MTDHPDLVIKIKNLILDLPFKDQWSSFVHDIARNHSDIIDTHKSAWCEVLAVYLNQQHENITGLLYDEEKQLFKKLIVEDHTGALGRALSRKGINI